MLLCPAPLNQPFTFSSFWWPLPSQLEREVRQSGSAGHFPRCKNRGWREAVERVCRAGLGLEVFLGATWRTEVRWGSGWSGEGAGRDMTGWPGGGEGWNWQDPGTGRQRRGQEGARLTLHDLPISHHLGQFQIQTSLGTCELSQRWNMNNAPNRRAKIPNTGNTKCWQRHGATGTLSAGENATWYIHSGRAGRGFLAHQTSSYQTTQPWHSVFTQMNRKFICT